MSNMIYLKMHFFVYQYFVADFVSISNMFLKYLFLKYFKKKYLVFLKYFLILATVFCISEDQNISSKKENKCPYDNKIVH